MSCTLYDGSGSIWPRACFPAYLFRRVYSSQGLMRSAADAWNYFETVESADAATRVRLSGTGWDPATDKSPWTPIIQEGNMARYIRGQTLHIQVCPSFSWKSQRQYGISADPVTDVYPPSCSTPIMPLQLSATNSPTITSTSSPANPPPLSNN
jgi:hypothetical protein